MAVPTTGFGLVALEIGDCLYRLLALVWLFINNDDLCCARAIITATVTGRCTPEVEKAVLSGMVQHKQHWIKGAAGTGLGGQQVVARHW